MLLRQKLSNSRVRPAHLSVCFVVTLDWDKIAKFMQLQLQYFLLLAAALFSIGIYGLITSRNAVRVLMSIELMLNAVNLNLMGFSNYLDPVHIKGQVFTVFVVTVAAAEAAVGLAIVLAIYRNRNTVDMEAFNLLKW